MISSISRILTLLSQANYRQLYALIFAMLVMGVLEVGGIGAVLPFMAAVSDMDGMLEHKLLRILYDYFDLDSKETFVLYLGGGVLAFLIARNLSFALVDWLISRFSMMWRHQLSTQLLSNYLMQPYSFFLTKNTLELKRKACNEVTKMVGGVIVPAIQLFTKSVLTICIAIFLVVIDPVVAALVAASIGGSYALLYGLVFRKLNVLSQQMNNTRADQFKLAGEAFEGIKELKISGNENRFIEEYAVLSHRVSSIEIVAQLISKLPRHAIETLSISAILVFVMYLVWTKQELSTWMPLLVVYVVSGYRILPALQNIFSALTTIRYNLATFDTVYEDLTNFRGTELHASSKLKNGENFKDFLDIILEQVEYRYPQSSEFSVHNLNLLIERNTTVGLVGPTGSGKTTVVDILLGLLQPQSGKLKVHGIEVTSANVREWQRCIGYVPQQIYLFDNTIANNIAFGVAQEDIDKVAVETAARAAMVHDFIANELPDGYETMVGQRGLRLSGGQLQRIGIARALYHKPDILILDEATSSLDSITERQVMDAI